MFDVLAALAESPTETFEPGETILEQGSESGKLFFLVEGMVAIIRSGTQINDVADRGAVFGEMSILLNTPHTATVQAVVQSKFIRVDDGARLLRENAEVSGYIAMILARRVNGLSRYLVDLKQQFADRDDHLGMVDDVLDTLLNRHPRDIPRRKFEPQ
jgi:CRP-like cAMP-binding protein